MLQSKAASQQHYYQLREDSNTSLKNQLGLKTKDLESELSKIKTSSEFCNKTELDVARKELKNLDYELFTMKYQEEINKIELERYKQL